MEQIYGNVDFQGKVKIFETSENPAFWKLDIETYLWLNWWHICLCWNTLSMMVTVGITRVIISSQGHWCRYLYRPLTIRPWTRGGRQGSNRASLPLVSCHRRPPTRPPHPHTHPGTATPQLTMGLGRPSPRLRDLSGEKAEARALCGGRRGRGTEDGGCWQPPASPTSPTILKSPTIPQDPKAQALQTAIRRWPKMLFKTTLWRWSFVTWALIRFR